MADNPTLYKDLMHCYRKLRLGTILEYCDVQTSEHWLFVLASPSSNSENASSGTLWHFKRQSKPSNIPLCCALFAFSFSNTDAWRLEFIALHSQLSVVCCQVWNPQFMHLQSSLLACDLPGAAANMAVSWMLASGNESTVQFSKPIYPQPIIFTGAPHSVAGIPRLLISQVTNDSFRVQAFGASCRGTQTPFCCSATFNSLPLDELL